MILQRIKQQLKDKSSWLITTCIVVETGRLIRESLLKFHFKESNIIEISQQLTSLLSGFQTVNDFGGKWCFRLNTKNMQVKKTHFAIF